MGYSSWSDAAYRGVAASRSTAAPAEIFRGTPTVDPLMDPRHALSTAVGLARSSAST